MNKNKNCPICGKELSNRDIMSVLAKVMPSKAERRGELISIYKKWANYIFKLDKEIKELDKIDKNED